MLLSPIICFYSAVTSIVCTIIILYLYKNVYRSVADIISSEVLLNIMLLLTINISLKNNFISDIIGIQLLTISA